VISQVDAAGERLTVRACERGLRGGVAGQTRGPLPYGFHFGKSVLAIAAFPFASGCTPAFVIVSLGAKPKRFTKSQPESFANCARSFAIQTPAHPASSGRQGRVTFSRTNRLVNRLPAGTVALICCVTPLSLSTMGALTPLALQSLSRASLHSTM